jgi:hypothetical protein
MVEVGIKKEGVHPAFGKSAGQMIGDGALPLLSGATRNRHHAEILSESLDLLADGAVGRFGHVIRFDLV